MRIPFIANAGQTDPSVAYYAPTFAGTVYVTRKGQIVYSLPGDEGSKSGVRPAVKKMRTSGERNGWSLTETAVGGKPLPKGNDPAPTGVSYFIGNDPARWRSGLSTFEGVSLGEVWPGISLDLQAHGKNVEKVFTVAPAGDPSRIRMSVAGASQLRVNEAGGLVVETGPGEVVFTPPAAFQEREGLRHPVKATYEVRGRQYGFQLSEYDRTLPVVIDPLLQATYLGGGGFDQGRALAIHPTSGDVYLAGITDSTNFPGTAGGAQAASGGSDDVFVARLNSALTTLNQVTYLGGSGFDQGYALAVHPASGDVYVTGDTFSTNFPGTAGGAQAANGGNTDSFVARLNAALTTLNQATYLGGSGDDDARALAVHPASGDVYVTGGTVSTDFPGTTGGAQAANGGNTETIVARLNAALTTLDQATYLGGSGEDFANALAIHPTSGNVYVAGQTTSTDFPITAGGAQAANGGGADTFVARLNAALTTLGQATYVGGGGLDAGRALAIHPTSSDVYVAGLTVSTDFPGTAGGAQAANGGGTDAFAARLNAALTTLGQATYLGSSDTDQARALAIHPTSSDVYVAGDTVSTDFPGTAGGAQTANGGGSDTFVARLNAALTTLGQATYLGGGGGEIGEAIAVHAVSGDVYVAGRADSTNFPGSAGGAQAASGGSADAFVARLTADLAAVTAAPVISAVTPTPVVGPTTPGVFYNGTFVISGQNFLGASVTTDGPLSLVSAPVVNATGTSISQRYVIGCCAPQEGQIFSLTVTTSGGSVSATDQITLSSTVPGLPLAVVANRGSNNLSAFTLNTTTGNTTPVPGSPFAAGIPAPDSVAIDSIHGFVYVAPFGGGTGMLAAFAIDRSTGALIPVPGSPFDVGGDPIAVTVDPGGRFVYVASFGTDEVSAFAINATSGVLTMVPGSPFAAGSMPRNVTVDPSGQFVYVANCGLGQGCFGTGPGSISGYHIDGTTGALTPVPGSPFAAGTNPFVIMVEPTGQFAYVANTSSNNVSAFTIGQSSGALTPVPGSPFPVGVQPGAIAFDPAGRFAYVANGGSSNISAFTINSDGGALTPIGTFTAGSVPVSLATDPTGQFLYVANAGSNDLTIYGINGFTGVLTSIGGVAVGTTPVSIATASITCSTITVSPSTLPDTPFGSPYNQTISASGGAAPYTFSVTAGSLPPGLTLSSGGVLSGTPSSNGPFNFTITATDSVSCTGTRSYTLTITPTCLTLSPAALPNGSVGVSYSQTISASGGTPPYGFGVTSGTLPPGLTLSTGGVLSGTPTTGGSYSFTITAGDTSQCFGSRAYTVTVTSGCAAVSISPAVLFEGFVGVAYRRALSGNGGTGPYSFSVTSGSLPPGLNLSGGVISGTPTAAGTYTFGIRAVDANGCAASRTYTLTISCRPVALSPPLLPSASQGVAYVQTLTVLGGPGPYTFSVTGGALPNGLTLLPSGAFSGAPADLGTFAFTVTATDADGCTGVQSYTLTVCTALTVSPAALPGAIVGILYSQTIAVTGGTGPYVFAQTGLPAPLTLAPATGILSGTPTLPGVFPVTVTGTDINGCSGVQNYILTVCPILTLSPASLPDGVVGTTYSQTFVASNGTGPYHYTAAGLPSFLTLSDSSGVLSGTPTAAGTFTFTVTASDANGCAVSHAYTIRVTDAPPVITELNLAPADGGNFVLSVTGSGFVAGSVVVVNGVSYPATFVSPTLVTVTLPASAIPAVGTVTVVVTNPGETGATSNPATLIFCTAPVAPVNPTIEPLGNPTGPITATDFLHVRWDPPATGPTSAFYEFRINGDAWSAPVAGTSAVALPQGINDPITLFVRAHCNAAVSSPAAASPTYSLAPPVADFTFSSARINSPVSFTDTSSPQATSWLWIFDDGGTSTVQSPTHTFTTAGTHRVALIASNGSGSNLKIKDVAVSASTAGAGAVTSSIRSFTTSDGWRWNLLQVAISGDRSAWLRLSAGEAETETIVYLRFVNAQGQVVLERRLSIAPGQSAVNDVTAYGLEGVYTLEIVADRKVIPILAEPAELPGRERKRPQDNP